MVMAASKLNTEISSVNASNDTGVRLVGLFMLALYAVAINCVASSTAGAQEAKLNGRLVDNFGSPVPNATLEISNFGISTSTDENGEYSLEYIPGSFSVAIKSSKHFTSSVDFSIAQPQAINLPETKLVQRLNNDNPAFLTETAYQYLQPCDTWHDDSDQKPMWYWLSEERLAIEPGTYKILVMPGSQNSRPNSFRLELVKINEKYLVTVFDRVERMVLQVHYNNFHGKKINLNWKWYEENLWMAEINLDPGVYLLTSILYFSKYALAPGIGGAQDNCFWFQVE